MKRKSASKRPVKNKVYILIVVDSPKTLRSLTDLFEEVGYEIATATDGIGALQVIKQRMPDLIILAAMTPKIDGLHVTYLIRLRSRVPIIILSTSKDSSAASQVLDLGADDYVVIEPFGKSELLARARAILKRTYPRRELI